MNTATFCGKSPKQMKAFPYAHFYEHSVTNTFLLMTVVMRVKPLYLLSLPSLRTTSDQSVAGNDIMRAHLFKPTDPKRAL